MVRQSGECGHSRAFLTQQRTPFNRSQVVKTSGYRCYTQTTADGDRNQYSTVASLNQTHDDNGNLTVSALGGSNNENRKFDESNMLVELERPGDNLEVAYRYDATGRRIAKEIDDNGNVKTIEYAYSGAEVIQEYAAGTGVEDKTFVYGPGIDNPIYMDAATSGTSYFGTNSIGSITALSNSSGVLLESYEYRPFGEETIKNASGTVISGTAYANPFMFTARRKDYEEGSDLYHFRTRQYSAITGRFISHDSIGDWGDAHQKGNGLAYCNNNPINWRDPFGLGSLLQDAIAKAAKEREGKQEAQRRSNERIKKWLDPDGSLREAIEARRLKQLYWDNMDDGGCETDWTTTFIIGGVYQAILKGGIWLGGRFIVEEAVEEAVGVPLNPKGIKDSVEDIAKLRKHLAEAMADCRAMKPDEVSKLLSGKILGMAKFRQVAADKLRALGLDGIDLHGMTRQQGEKALKGAGFVVQEVTETGRKIWTNPKTGARITHDQGKALVHGQRPHWTIQDRAGTHFNSCGREAKKGNMNAMGGKHIAGRGKKKR